MSSPRERQPSAAQIERKITYADFVLSILDNRYKIEEALLEKATSIHMTYNGYQCENYETPEILDYYLQPFSAITIDLSAHRNEDGISVIEHIAIYPEDSDPLTLRQHEDFTTIQSGEEQAILPADALDTTLRQLLPYAAKHKASVSQILDLIHASSAESIHSISYAQESDGQQREITLSKIETLDDSIETLEVIKYIPHASGAHVGTRMHLSESIGRRRQTNNPDRTDHELVIQALHKYDEAKELTIETILNTTARTVAVDTATRRHINDISEVLDTLK